MYRCGEYVKVVLFQELRRKLMNVVSSIFRHRRETTVYVQRINNRLLTGRRRFRAVSKLFILYIYIHSYPDTMFNLFKPNLKFSMLPRYMIPNRFNSTLCKLLFKVKWCLFRFTFLMPSELGVTFTVSVVNFLTQVR